MSFTNADGKALAAYIDALILKEAYDKAVLSSKKEDDDDADIFDLDEMLDEYGGEIKHVSDPKIINISIDVNTLDDKIVFGTNPDKSIHDDYDDRVDDSSLFSP